MKPDIQNPELASLLARYLSGEMTREEQAAFENSHISSAEEIRWVESLRKDWEAIGKTGKTELPDTAAAWNSLRSRLNNEQLIPSNENRAAHFKFTYLRVAATVVILLTAAVFLYLSRQKVQSPVQMMSIVTGSDSLTLVKTLDDGSVIYLSGKTALSYPRIFASGSRNVRLEGEAFFDIQRDSLKPFIIETQDASIEVLGTAFNVKNRLENDFDLYVERGRVKVTSKTDPEHPVIVSKGEKVSLTGKNLQKSEAGEAFPWYRQRMHFKDETLDHVLEVMNRNFGVTFVLKSEQAGSRRLTLTCDEGVGKMTELICLLLNLKSQIHNDTIVLRESNSSSQ